MYLVVGAVESEKLEAIVAKLCAGVGARRRGACYIRVTKLSLTGGITKKTFSNQLLV
jgi:hypothetical protein